MENAGKTAPGHAGARTAAVSTAATLAILAASLTGCAGQKGETKETDGLISVKVGISPFQDTYLPVIGEEKGWFEEAGLKVELKSLAWNAITPALISGDVDLAINNTTGVVSIAGADPEIVYAYGWNPFTQGSALMIRANGDLRPVDQWEAELGDHSKARTATLEALAGRTIVTTLSTDMGKQIVDALASVGMSQDDVTLVDMDPDAGLAAFLTGTGDAYLGGVPQRAKALSEGMIIGLSGPDLAAPPINGVLAKRQFVEDNEKALLAFINVMHRIIRYCDAETDACGTSITERLNNETAAGLTLEGFKDYWQKIELYAPDASAAREMILDPQGVSYWKTTWDSDNAYLVDTGAIPAPVDGATNFLMQSVWDSYVAEYGETETGY
jgi:ABC-type nitrate/sulfonate/bicarbonate transport system substrate-binding protein